MEEGPKDSLKPEDLIVQLCRDLVKAVRPGPCLVPSPCDGFILALPVLS